MKEETINDIVSELRCESALPTSKDDFNESLRGLASRIEAAAKREREAAQSARDTRDAMDYAATAARPAFVGVDLAKDKPTFVCATISPGNAAAMREALESIEDDCRVLDRKDMWEEEGECYYDALRDIREKVSAALAAPARNCDICRTLEDADFAYANRKTTGLRFSSNSDFVAWLFAPAEGGDHA